MRNNLHNQHGAALAVGLIILVIITLMGYTGMKGTMLQEKMAAGLHNRSMANTGSHSALREGEEFLFNLIESTNGVPVKGTPTGGNFNVYSLYQEPGVPTSGLNTFAEAFKANDWNTVSGTGTDFNFTAVPEKGASLSVLPEYIIQQMKDTSSTAGVLSHEFGEDGGGAETTQEVYLITAKSRSGDGNSYAIAESVYTVVTSSTSTN